MGQTLTDTEATRLVKSWVAGEGVVDGGIGSSGRWDRESSGSDYHTPQGPPPANPKVSIIIGNAEKVDLEQHH